MQGQELAGEAAQASTPLSGLVTIESDIQKADNATGVITASGNVRIVYSDRGVVATSRQAQYFSREGRVVLSGDVEVVQEGGNRLLADRVVYLVEQERLVAHPEQGQQVTSRVRIPPPQPAAAAGSAPGSTPGSSATTSPPAAAPLPEAEPPSAPLLP
ncbi:MAG: hypothetical protein R6W06_12520 [Prochlorococcaceae cyanobacterium]